MLAMKPPSFMWAFHLKKHGIIACLIVGGAAFSGIAEAGDKPLFRDFMGLNGHYHFKPELYQKNGRLVRNYHSMNWDVAKPGDQPTFPVCVNKVDWDKVYGRWAQHGFDTDLCVMFARFGESSPNYRELWQGHESWAFSYGNAMAAHFGPTQGNATVSSIEIGNEPGNDFDDDLYQSIFIQMAEGIRKADPKLKIVTCAAHADPADKYAKNFEETFSSPRIKNLYDVLNVHVYATKPKRQGQSPWARSYPEDPGIDYLKVVERVIDWKNRNAPGKQVWITEFGWDACTPDAMSRREGWAKKLAWQGQTDLQQAQYIVRSFLVFAAMDVQRAYLYFYNDDDKPSVHAASGLTRHFKPKMSYWAVSHLYQQLGEFRFSRVVEESEEKFIYELVHRDGDKRAWVCWMPVDAVQQKRFEIALPFDPGRIERMPTSAAAGDVVDVKSKGRTIALPLSGSPVYVFSK